MQPTKGYAYLGNISKPRPQAGTFLVHLATSVNPEELTGGMVFVEIDGNFIPFFIGAVLPLKGRRIEIAFEDVSRPAQIDHLIGRELYLPESKSKSKSKEQHNDKGPEALYVIETDYEVLDENAKTIGRVEAILENPAHPILQLSCDGKEVLVPVTGQTIVKIDTKKRQLHVKLPPGLLDIYL